MRKILIPLLGLLMAAASLVVLAGPAQAAPRTCNVYTYDTKVRNVTGRAFYAVDHVSARGYANRTRITESRTARSRYHQTLRTRVSASAGASVGASGVLRKIVKVFGEIKGEGGFTSRIRKTESGSIKVRSRRDVVIPANTTVVWYSGYRVAKGTYEYSRCGRIDGKDGASPNGVVSWRKGRWSSMRTRDSGSWRCDRRANTPVQAKAQRIVGCR